MKKIISLLTAIILMLSIFTLTIPMLVSAAGEGDVLCLTATFKEGDLTSGKNIYAVFKNQRVPIVEGDYLSYDVFSTSGQGGIGGVDAMTANWFSFRGSSSVDQNGLRVHPSQELTEFNLNKWYTRKIVLDESCWNRYYEEWMIAMDNWQMVGTVTVKFDNIKVFDKDNKVKATIYESGAPSKSEAAAISGITSWEIYGLTSNGKKLTAKGADISSTVQSAPAVTSTSPVVSSTSQSSKSQVDNSSTKSQTPDSSISNSNESMIDSMVSENISSSNNATSSESSVDKNKSNTALIAIIIAVVILAGGGVATFLVLKNEKK